MDSVTVAEAARILGVSSDTVRRRIAAGDLPAERVTARLFLVPLAALQTAETGRRRPGPKPARTNAR